MHDFLVWLEGSALSVWVREEPSVFAFPSILTAHTVGMGLVAGMNALLALRMLGIAAGVPLLELRRFFPVMWFGFWLNAVSGVVLLIGYPTKALTNPVFYSKLIFIALAMLLVQRIHRILFRDPESRLAALAVLPARLKTMASASLFCWAAAIMSGRFLAYTYVHLMSRE